MDISQFLAKVVGFYLVILGLACFTRRELLRTVIDDYFQNSALVVFGAAINLILGLLLVLSHNIWELNWKVIITIFGYLALLKGILHLFATQFSHRLAVKMRDSDAFVYAGVIYIALGAYLLYHGYRECIQGLLA